MNLSDLKMEDVSSAVKSEEKLTLSVWMRERIERLERENYFLREERDHYKSEFHRLIGLRLISIEKLTEGKG